MDDSQPGSQQSIHSPFLVRVAVTEGPHAGSVHVLQHLGAFLIGRGSHAEIALPHDLLAGVEHCRLTISDQGCEMEDLGSRAGTLINGHSRASGPVQSGDTLQVGLSQIEIRISNIDAVESTACYGPPQAGIRATIAGSASRHGRAPPSSPGSTNEPSLMQVPGYHVRRKLGEGGMGIVYEATRIINRQRVALKTIIPAAGTGEKARQLFRREMQLLSQLDHPNIVRFVESGEHAGQVYLVMEFVDAIDLPSLLAKATSAQQLKVYCKLMCQVLQALEYAHQRKLVHRDVKPRNILVARKGQQLLAKLADFGLAKNFELAGLSQLTEDQELRGTLAFMPWEQLTSSRYARPTVDIYSTAATLYYFLVGRSPGHSKPQSKSLVQKLATLAGLPARHRKTRDDLELPPSVPAALAPILGKALAANPRERYASAADFRAALLPFCGNFNE